MDSLGFIHGELDIKILILYILRRLPRPVEAEALTELTRDCDDCVGWFDYSDCLASLVDSGHVDRLEGPRYAVTEKGRRNGETTESSLPYSVRMRAERLLEPVAEVMRREAMIKTSHIAAEDGIKALLSLSDGKGEILAVSLLVGSEEQAERAEAAFRRDAEGVYGKLTEILLETK